MIKKNIINLKVNNMRIWICAIAKMEELYIREWIEWNKKIGIDHIVLADNNDSDYEILLQPIIQDYIDEGYVELIDKKNILGVQQPFYNEVYLNRRDEFDWMGFIDIDEFIELPAYNNNIHKFLSDIKFINCEAVILSWLLYNDNGQLYYENKPVIERFTKSISEYNYIGIKYFIRSLQEITKLISHHSPENIYPKEFNINVVDVLGDKNFERNLRNNTTNKYTQIKRQEEYYNIAYISHYITKSTEEYIKYRMLRGRGDRKINAYELRYTYKFYFNFNEKTNEKQKLFDKYENKINIFQNEILKKYNNII